MASIFYLRFRFSYYYVSWGGVGFSGCGFYIYVLIIYGHCKYHPLGPNIDGDK